MNFRSILFVKKEERRDKELLEAPAFFVDLNLDQIVDAVTAGREEYHLKPFFFTPLTVIDAIKYRQEVAQDLENDAYHLAKSGQGEKNSSEMTDLYRGWVEKYPIVSIEDGLAENDWEGFREQTAALGGKTQIVGDDIYVTNTQFIERGIREKTTNAVLIKLNQIGTITETIEAVDLCRKAGWGFVVSHRSGETEDPFIADFAVAMGGGQIKTGSLCRSERMAKYNRLLEIELGLGKTAVFGNPLGS